MNAIRYAEAEVDGLTIFYREAGPSHAPVLLLLHGYPTSSHMFRTLIPRIAGRYRVVAPDLPGFGRSSMPPRSEFSYTFARLASVMERFTEQVGLERFSMYLFDYGAPVGLRMAMNRPERVQAIVSQNGNAYDEGLSPGWAAMREFWRDPAPEVREAMRSAFTPASLSSQYTAGVPGITGIDPDGAALDAWYLSRPGAEEVQLDLFQDYGDNVACYPAFQSYLRTQQPPLLAVWGRNDPYFVPAGAEAFRRDVRDAEIHLLDTGHFALETHVNEIAALMLDFLGRRLPE